jgi:hypothetical protein
MSGPVWSGLFNRGEGGKGDDCGSGAHRGAITRRKLASEAALSRALRDSDLGGEVRPSRGARPRFRYVRRGSSAQQRRGWACDAERTRSHCGQNARERSSLPQSRPCGQGSSPASTSRSSSESSSSQTGAPRPTRLGPRGTRVSIGRSITAAVKGETLSLAILAEGNKDRRGDRSTGAAGSKGDNQTRSSAATFMSGKRPHHAHRIWSYGSFCTYSTALSRGSRARFPRFRGSGFSDTAGRRPIGRATPGCSSGGSWWRPCTRYAARRHRRTSSGGGCP